MRPELQQLLRKHKLLVSTIIIAVLLITGALIAVGRSGNRHKLHLRRSTSRSRGWSSGTFRFTASGSARPTG